MPISNIDLKQLRYFVTIAEELSFSRAAERLNISQPPLSAHIKSMEETLDVVLFERTKRRVELTYAGKYLYKKAQDILSSVESTLTTTQSVKHGEYGILRIGTNYSTLFHPAFTKITTAFHKKFPDVRLKFQEMMLDDTVEALIEGDIDASFSWPERRVHYRDIAFESVTQAPLRLCASTLNPLSKKESISIEDLREERLLLSARQLQGSFYNQLKAMAQKRGFYLNIHQETIIFPMIIHLISSDYGLGIVPEFMIKHAQQDIKPLVIRDIDQEEFNLKISIAYNNARKDIKTQNFLQIAKDIAKQYS